MKELIAELERAEEGSRELDAKIELSRRQFLGLAGAAWVANYTLDRGRVLGWIWDGENISSQTEAPHYTTNLQDALGLVPEDYEWELSWLDGRAEFKMGDPSLGIESECATPPLAVVATALKARQEQHDGLG